MIAGLLRFLFMYLLLGFLLRLTGRVISKFREGPVRREAPAAPGAKFPDAEDVDFEEVRQDR